MGSADVHLVYPADGSIVDVDLELRPSETLVLYGPNGSGKSTILRLLAGTLGGGALLDAAYLPQTPHLFRGTVARNLALGLTVEETAHARQLLDDFGLGDLVGRHAAGLSGGQRQRVLLARTLAQRSAWVLLDEPLAAFDVADRMSTAAVIRRQLAERSAVVVTHEQDEAMMLADRVAVVIEGDIAQIGAPGAVFGMPADASVAAALGLANVFDGVVAVVEGALCGVDIDGARVWGVGAGKVGAPARVTFGAETVTLYSDAGASGGSARNWWVGTVEQLRPVGRLVEVVVTSGTLQVLAVVTPGAVDALDIAPGVVVTAAAKATAVRVLSA